MYNIFTAYLHNLKNLALNFLVFLLEEEASIKPISFLIPSHLLSSLPLWSIFQMQSIWINKSSDRSMEVYFPALFEEIMTDRPTQTNLLSSFWILNFRVAYFNFCLAYFHSSKAMGAWAWRTIGKTEVGPARSRTADSYSISSSYGSQLIGWLFFGFRTRQKPVNDFFCFGL